MQGGRLEAVSAHNGDLCSPTSPSLYRGGREARERLRDTDTLDPRMFCLLLLGVLDYDPEGLFSSLGHGWLLHFDVSM
jgi:hypothetical protein